MCGLPPPTWRRGLSVSQPGLLGSQAGLCELPDSSLAAQASAASLSARPARLSGPIVSALCIQICSLSPGCPRAASSAPQENIALCSCPPPPAGSHIHASEASMHCNCSSNSSDMPLLPLQMHIKLHPCLPPSWSPYKPCRIHQRTALPLQQSTQGHLKLQMCAAHFHPCIQLHHLSQCSLGLSGTVSCARWQKLASPVLAAPPASCISSTPSETAQPSSSQSADFYTLPCPASSTGGSPPGVRRPVFLCFT